jgi:hypothetical protein
MKSTDAVDVLEFLRRALAGGDVPVAELEMQARAAGLLGQDTRIGDAKAFRVAKRCLGIRTRRVGFGPCGGWHWQLPCAEPALDPSCAHPSGVIDKEVHSRPDQEASAEPSGADPQSAPTERAHRIPPEWVRGVALLQRQTRSSDVPQHRWKLFIVDCARFLTGPWAQHASELGWETVPVWLPLRASHRTPRNRGPPMERGGWRTRATV